MVLIAIIILFLIGISTIVLCKEAAKNNAEKSAMIEELHTCIEEFSREITDLQIQKKETPL